MLCIASLLARLWLAFMIDKLSTPLSIRLDCQTLELVDDMLPFGHQISSTRSCKACIGLVSSWFDQLDQCRKQVGQREQLRFSRGSSDCQSNNLNQDLCSPAAEIVNKHAACSKQA